MSQLARLGVAGELSEIVSEGEGQLEDVGGEETLTKAPTAEDFADIAEVVLPCIQVCVAVVTCVHVLGGR